MRYFLDELEVESPVGMDGLTLRKGISQRYWGYLYRKLGYAEGLSDLQFEEVRAVRLLQKQLKTYKLAASTRFRIVADSGRTLYDGFINYSSYQWDGLRVSVQLQDDPAIVSLETQAATTFSLSADTVVRLHARRLGGVVQLLTDPNTLVIQRATKDPTTVTHSLPLTRKNDKEDTVQGVLVPVVTPLALDPLYRNTTDKEQSVKLNGLVRVSAVASSSATVRLLATALDSSGETRSEVEIGQFGVSGTVSGQFLVDVRVQVPVGGSLRLWWSSPELVGSWKFTYDAPGTVGATLVSVTDELSLSGSDAIGMSMLEALRSLVTQCSKGKLSFRSRLFESGDGAGLFLFNGAAIRGVSKPMVTTLQDLFEGLNCIWNLSMWEENNTVWIEQKANAPKKRTIIRQAFKYSQRVATDYVYPQIQIGYQTWKGDSLLAGEEPNGNRAYATSVTSLTKGLSIRSSLIAASTLIEEQRRKQIDAKTAGDSKVESLDDALFVVCAVKNPSGWQAETTEHTSYATGVTDTDTLYNTRITPRRNLERWRDWLQGSIPLRLSSSEGATSLLSNYDGLELSEGSVLTGPDSDLPMLATAEVPMRLDEYADLGDWIDIDVPGLKASGRLLDAQWRLSGQGETATLQLLTY